MVASPLPFLSAEERLGNGQAREALFCSCNVDLGFFEQTVLGAAEATGARVTVVGDARAPDPDPGPAPGAGTRYVHGLAAPGSGGAFHAKVIIVAGRERALVAIGSGDLSPGGWGLNKESWTVATADREACPELVADIADWLRSLDGLCALAPLAASGISRTAALLEELAVKAEIVDTGHRLVHTSARPIVGQLPPGQVEHLLLYAPFHDERTATVQELIARLRPARVTLAVQRGGRTVIQPTALRRVIAAAGIPVQIVEDAGERYRHETLIEAVRPDGSRWALTGSPDLSVRALLTPAGKGGSIEVGVVSHPAASLFPEATRPLPLQEVPAVRLPGNARALQVDGAVLLAAARAGDGLEVALARPAAWPTPLEASRADGFDVWEAIGSVPAGAASHVFAGADLPGGTRVRRAQDADGAPGPVVFVIDPELAMLRARGHAVGPGGAARAGRADRGRAAPGALAGRRWLVRRHAPGRRGGPRAAPGRRRGELAGRRRRRADQPRHRDVPPRPRRAALRPGGLRVRTRPRPARTRAPQNPSAADSGHGQAGSPPARHRPPCLAHPRAVRGGGRGLGRPAGAGRLGIRLCEGGQEPGPRRPPGAAGLRGRELGGPRHVPDARASPGGRAGAGGRRVRGGSRSRGSPAPRRERGTGR